ncbi:glycoside hydrolase family 6 protein [Amycolatopsis minnesotensis]|uniref:Glucanase n=1 Tax=Amycolatopsis minnesotensis TaxID=337894 RepID=A0ABP5E0G7_9PSEU
MTVGDRFFPRTGKKPRRSVVVLGAVVVFAAVTATPVQAVTASNPLAVTDGFYADPDSNPARWVRENPEHPDAAAIRTEIAERPGARWFADPGADTRAEVSAYTSAARTAGKLPILVAYDLPDRDCGGHSGGGAASPAEYRDWLSGFADGIADRPAVVVIEPDALAQLDCLTEEQKATRIDLLSFAANEFASKNPNTWAYLDAGNANWVEAGEMANRLRRAGVGKIRGFALNTSNYYTTEESVAKGKAITGALGGAAHYVVDTSRNGNGANGEWCNPAGRKLGVPSQTSGDAEMLLWVKVPGDSDGDCGIGTGIPAGKFSPVLAKHLIDGGPRGFANTAPRGDVPPPASGRTLTVGEGGRYGTIQQAADAAQPGDNVEIAAGTYAGGLRLEHGGAQDRYITFYGKGGPAVVTGGDGDRGQIAIGDTSWLRFIGVTAAGSAGFGAMANGADHLVFQDFRVDGSQDGGLVVLGSRDVLVDGCEISGTNARGTSADHEAMSLGEGSSGIEVRGCRVHDNGEEGIDVKYDDDAKAKIHDNLVYDNRGPNIYVDSSSGVEIYNNTVYATKNETKAGIGLAVEDYSESRKLDNVSVYNNVSYGNAGAGLGFWMESDGTMSNVRVVNNTFHGNKKGSIGFDVPGVDGENLLRNNIFGEGAESPDGFTADHNAVGDPGFTDPGAADFHLAPGSAAIDAGTGDGAPAFDRDNAPRPSGKAVDVGAYESR